jgi:hypothetical protein
MLSATSTLILGSELGAEFKVLVVGKPWERVTNWGEFYGGKQRLTRSPAAPGALSFPKSCWRAQAKSVESKGDENNKDSLSSGSLDARPYDFYPLVKTPVLEAKCK